MLKKYLKYFAGIGSIVLALHNSAVAQEDEASGVAKSALGIVRKIRTASQYFTDAKNVLDFAEASRFSKPSSDEVNRLHQSVQDLSSNAGSSFAMASGATGMAAANAVLGSVLFPVAEAENERLRKLTNNDYHAAVLSGDSAAITKFGMQADAVITETSSFRPAYGSFTDSVSRVFKTVSRSSGSFASAQLEVLSGQLGSMMKERSIASASRETADTNKSPIGGVPIPAVNSRHGSAESLQSENAEATPESSVPDVSNDHPTGRKNGLRLAGVYELDNGQFNYTEYLESSENPCMELEGSLIDYARNMRGGDNPLCSKLAEEADDTRYSYLGQCKIFGTNGFTGRWSKGLFEAKVTPEKGLEATWSAQDWDQGALKISSRSVYAACEYVEPDCSPEGQAAWKAQNGGGPVIFCESPL